MGKIKVVWQQFYEFTLDQARSGSINELIVHQEIYCHIIFDVKHGIPMENKVCGWRPHNRGTKYYHIFQSDI